MPGAFSMQRERSSTFTLSEDDSFQTRDFTPRVALHGRVLRLLLRALLRVIRGCAWLALLGLVGSVPLWLGILVAYFLLRRSLSVLRGGTEWSLAPMLLALLRLLLSLVGRGAIRSYLWLQSFTLKPPWSFLALGCWGAGLLYVWTIWLLQWGG